MLSEEKEIEHDLKNTTYSGNTNFVYMYLCTVDKEWKGFYTGQAHPFIFYSMSPVSLDEVNNTEPVGR